MTISYDKFATLVSEFKGTRFIYVDLCATVDLALGKKNPHKGRIQKHTKGIACAMATNANINAYQSANNKRLEKAGSVEKFEIKKHGYADPVQGYGDIPVLEHRTNGQQYFRYIVREDMQAIKPEIHYTLDGDPIEVKDIIGFKAKPPRATYKGKDANGAAVIIEKAVIVNPKIESLVAIRGIDKGVEYTAKDWTE